jgi:hypothetical protein
MKFDKNKALEKFLKEHPHWYLTSAEKYTKKIQTEIDKHKQLKSRIKIIIKLLRLHHGHNLEYKDIALRYGMNVKTMITNIRRSGIDFKKVLRL